MHPLHRLSFAAATAALVLVLLVPSSARAGDIRAGLKITLGLAGEGEVDVSGAGYSTSTSDDLLPTAGFTLFGEYELFEFLSVGGLLGFKWWETDDMAAADVDANLIVEIGAVARGHYGFLDDTLIVFLAFPFGLAISDLSSDYEKAVGLNSDPGVGAHVGLVAGAAYKVWSALHVFAELGWQYHFLAHDTEVLGTSVSVDLSGSQMALNFGAYWEF